MLSPGQFAASAHRALLCCVALALVGCAGQTSPNAAAQGEVDQRRVELGRDLFFDTRLSADGTISCASCHDLSAGGDDGRKTAIGIGDAQGPINTPTVLNSGLNFAQFWDGRARNLQEQVAGPITNPIEMGSSWRQVLSRLAADPPTVERFQASYPEGLNEQSVADAIAAYERALLTLNSPFDRFLQGEQEAISSDAAEGYALFQKLGCVSCHQGRALGGNLYQRLGVMEDYFELRGRPPTQADLGRFNVTGRQEDKYRFKVPGLRNVALTGPYFHDGSAQSLEDAVRTMGRFQVGLPVADVQVAKLVAFLESLTGDVREELK